jgi:hypothetical protein
MRGRFVIWPIMKSSFHRPFLACATCARAGIIVAAALLLGCQAKTPPAASASTKPKPVAVTPEQGHQARQPKGGRESIAAESKLNGEATSAIDSRPLRPSNDRGTLVDLVAAANASQFELPQLDDAKIAAAGIRKLSGQYIVIYTDLAAAPDIDELPQVFDAAVPQWCDYFGVDPSTAAAWKIVGSVMQDKNRFIAAGLYPEKLPEFPNGFNRGSQLWLYDQQSSYYRRHLLLHEGTHAFMDRWLGNAGPPWYAEGTAELFGTHRWTGGKLLMGIMPASKEETPFWGRIKAVKDAYASKTALSLIDIMQYDSRAHLQNEAYAWCWAAAIFFDQHPQTQSAFRGMKSEAKDTSLNFSRRFYDRIKDRWPQIAEDWQIFIAECDYGYDIPRSVVTRKDAVDLPAAGATVTLATDRGWQSTGYRLQAGKTYRLTASGRYEIAHSPKPWPCEAGGVTIRYVGGHPLGMLLASLTDLEGEQPLITPLVSPQPIGLSAEIEPQTAGTLYLKINEPSSGLFDNSGTLTVTIRVK